MHVLFLIWSTKAVIIEAPKSVVLLVDVVHDFLELRVTRGYTIQSRRLPTTCHLLAVLFLLLQVFSKCS